MRTNKISACARELSGPVLQAKPQLYHPSEDISDCEESDENGDAILKPAENSRTIIEVIFHDLFFPVKLFNASHTVVAN